jgi:hypothetical protein
MASSTKFSEKIFPPISATNNSNPATQVAPRKEFFVISFQAIILLIKINKNWFLKDKRISFQKLIFQKF